jgi:GNAT superfamily N-acetyltransferase
MIGFNYPISNSNEGLFFMALKDVRLTGYIPGAIGRVAELHGTYYHQHWGFHLFFESRVAIELSEFLRRFNEARDGFWAARIEEKIVGAVAIDGVHHDSQGAHLRWFIIAPENQGHGIGNRLLNEAVEFCRKKEHGRIYLWTFAGLHPARHLYEKFGFKLCEEHEGEQWGRAVTEQKFELIL